MKALDTSILLVILHGGREAQRLLPRLQGEEVATTEANLVELVQIASGSSRNTRKRRLEMVDKLRRRLTVLPIDDRAGRVAIQATAGFDLGSVPSQLLLAYGALEASACQELLTTRDSPRVPGRWDFRVTNA